MEDPLTYTLDGLERELNLLEIHLKESPEGDENFCKDCILKHLSTARAFALEGISFTSDENEIKKFLDAEKQLREIKGSDYKKQGVELSQKVRSIRKNLYDECLECTRKIGEKKVALIKKFTKDLNTKSTSNNSELNFEKKKMVTYKELGVMNASQFAAEGVRYLAETYPSTEPGKYEKYLTIGGGVALQALGVFVKMSNVLKTVSVVTGSNLLANGIVKWVREPEVPVVAAAVAANTTQGTFVGPGTYPGKFAGKTFGGRVTAQNIPTQYARAGILQGAQAFEAPEHADLIRVD